MGQGGPAAHDTERPPVPTKVPVLSEYLCVGMVDVWGGAAGFGAGLSESLRTLARVPGGWGGDVDNPST